MRKVWQVKAGSWLALPLAVQSGLAASGAGRSFTRKMGVRLPPCVLCAFDGKPHKTQAGG